MITPNIIERSWIQGATVAVEYLTGTAFSGENGAHTFRITGKDAEGQPVAVSGTVLAKILRADNITVDVSGSVVDGVAEVTLVGDCYNVPGRTSLVIFLSDGTNTVTLYAAIFNVFRSTSGVEIDSGVYIPTLTELLAQIERMETATEAAEEAADAVEQRIVPLENLEKTAITYSYGSNNTFAYYDRVNTSSSNISRIVSWVDVSQYSAIYYSRRKNTNSGSNAGMHFADAGYTFISGQRDIVGAEENGYEMTLLPVPEGATKARFTAFNDTEAYGDFVLYGVSKLVKIVTDLAENDPVQDTAIAANTAAVANLTKTMTKLVDVTLTETAAINITQDTNGNALSIKNKLLAFVLFPKDSEVKQPSYLVLFKNQNAEVGRMYGGEVSVTTLAGYKPGAIGVCENYGGIWRGYYSQTNANIEGASGTLIGYGTRQMYTVEGHPITSISTSQELLAGTQIIVWGC